MSVKLKTGFWVDKNNSNYYEPLEYQNEQEEGEVKVPGRFKSENLVPLTFFWLTSVVALILIAFAFKFALLANINQGCIPILFSFAGIYCAVIFYFKFGEVLSCSKILGIFLMLLSVVMLSLESSLNAKTEVSASTLVETSS